MAANYRPLYAITHRVLLLQKFTNSQIIKSSLDNVYYSELIGLARRSFSLNPNRLKSEHPDVFSQLKKVTLNGEIDCLTFVRAESMIGESQDENIDENAQFEYLYQMFQNDVFKFGCPMNETCNISRNDFNSKIENDTFRKILTEIVKLSNNLKEVFENNENNIDLVKFENEIEFVNDLFHGFQEKLK